MGHLQELRGLGRIDIGVEGACLGRPIEGKSRAPEDQQVEIELARAPALARRPTELALRSLSGQERCRAGRRVRSAGT
jgi:hypothetical protein